LLYIDSNTTEVTNSESSNDITMPPVVRPSNEAYASVIPQAR